MRIGPVVENPSGENPCADGLGGSAGGNPQPGSAAAPPHANGAAAARTNIKHASPRHGPRRQHGHRPLYGALDLGTNNCRLLIAHPTPSSHSDQGSFKVVDAFSRIVRLGEGLSRTGSLSEAAMERALSALKVCARKIDRLSVTRLRLIATEACRAASNGQAFLDRVRQETDLDLEIIDRETEARLAVAGSASLLDHQCRNALVFDIGGGSTELILLGLENGRYRLKGWTSINIGVVTLAERHGGVDVLEATYNNMKNDLAGPLRTFCDAHGAGDSFSGGGGHLLGTSGTVTTMAGVVLNLDRYVRARVDGCWLSCGDVRDVSARLLAMNYDQRVASPCIGRERADLVLAGCAIAEAILETWPCERIRVADRGLREGMLTMLMDEDGALSAAPGKPRRRRRRRRKKPSAPHGNAPHDTSPE